MQKLKRTPFFQQVAMDIIIFSVECQVSRQIKRISSDICFSNKLIEKDESLEKFDYFILQFFVFQ